MTVARLGTALVSAALLSGALAGAGPASAQTCDAYSGGCASPAPTAGTGGGGGGGTDTTGGSGGAGGTGTAGGAGTSGGTLPFTGGEVVLLSAVGLGAVGAGSLLVVAGRKRRTA